VDNSEAETVRSRGLQKLFSASAKGVRGSGDGDGESEGQDVADRRYDPWLAEGGWMNTTGGQQIIHYLYFRPRKGQTVCGTADRMT
jgi:hypothetical protein